jgi:preprotein translocase subunit YajC
MHASLFLLQATGNPNAIFANLAVPFAIFAIFYFIVFRPQQKQRKQLETLMRGLKRGDEVVTLGGLVGEVQHVRELVAGQPGSEDHVTIRSGESRLVVERGRIARVIAPKGGAAA